MIGALISFVTIPVITLYITPDEFGKASMFTVVQFFVSSFIYLGMDQSFTREYHYVKNKNVLFQNALILPLLFSTIMIILGILFKEQFSVFLFEDSRYTDISILFGIMSVFMVVERFILLSIRMEEKAAEYSFYSVLVKIIVFIVTLLMVIYGDRNFLSIVYSTIFGQIIGDIILIVKYNYLLRFKRSYVDKKLIKNMLIFGLPIIVSSSLYNLLNTLGRFFLRGFSTFHEIGIYTAALKIAGILSLVQVTFTSFWVPVAYQWNKEKKEMKYFNYMSDLILFLMTIVFFFVVFFKKYIVLILSSEYREAEYVAALLALTPILYTISETTTLGIVFSGKSKYNIATSIFALLPAILLNALLVPYYGTVGASISTAFAYLIFYFIRTYFSIKCGFNIKVKHQVPVVFILFMVAVFNSFNNKFIIIINLLLMIVSIFLQYRFVLTSISIIKEPNNWDFT